MKNTIAISDGRYRRVAPFVLAILLLALGAGCNARHVAVKVDAFAGDPPACQRYYVIPGQQHVESSNLEFQEYQRQIIQALDQAGYRQDVNSPCLIVFLSFGVGNPSHVSSVGSIPQFGVTPSGSYGVTGNIVYSRVDTLHTRKIVLDAMDVSGFAQTNKMIPVWKVTATSIGSDGSLREVFPSMLKAAQDYIGKSGTFEVTVSPETGQVKDMTGRRVLYGR